MKPLLRWLGIIQDAARRVTELTLGSSFDYATCQSEDYLPARARPGSHELLAEHLVILNHFPHLERFLSSDDLILFAEPIHFLGRYSYREGARYSSGLIGMPPGCDLPTHVRDHWHKIGSPKLTADEKKWLVTQVVLSRPHIMVPQTTIIEIYRYWMGRVKTLGEGMGSIITPYKITGDEGGIHTAGGLQNIVLANIEERVSSRLRPVL